jgi:hypothetical protein
MPRDDHSLSFEKADDLQWKEDEVWHMINLDHVESLIHQCKTVERKKYRLLKRAAVFVIERIEGAYRVERDTVLFNRVAAFPPMHGINRDGMSSRRKAGTGLIDALFLPSFKVRIEGIGNNGDVHGRVILT